MLSIQTTFKDTQEIKDFLSTILPGSYGEDYIIAGGYARDKYFGVENKDIDVVLSYSNETLLDVIDTLYANGVVYNSYGCEYGNSSVDDRMEAVIKLPLHGIDLLFSKFSISKAVDMMDYNINQCYIGYDNTVVYPNGEPTELILCVPDITQQRKDYIEAKWEKLRAKVQERH